MSALTYVASAVGRLVSVIKATGGVGATALLNQLAIRFMHKETASGRQACVIDLDVQFGDVAFQLFCSKDVSLASIFIAFLFLGEPSKIQRGSELRIQAQCAVIVSDGSFKIPKQLVDPTAPFYCLWRIGFELKGVITIVESGIKVTDRQPD